MTTPGTEELLHRYVAREIRTAFYPVTLPLAIDLADTVRPVADVVEDAVAEWINE